MATQRALDTGNTAWMLMSAAMVMLMTPGLGFFHAGLAGKKNTTNTILMSMMSMALVTVQWVLVGYSFTFGKGGNDTFGRFHEAALRHLGIDVSDTYGGGVPSLIFVAFQNMFAQITPALISGAVLGRMNFLAYMLFIFTWSVCIYNPIANWVWAMRINEVGSIVPKGWLLKLGNIDFAGGAVIHIASGFSALAITFMLGKKRDKNSVPNNTLITLGTSLLWFGWFGFNAGSQVAADGIAALAFINTHIAACFGLITWVTLEYLRTRKVTALGTASGVIAGLVCITPGCGYVDPMVSFLFGFAGALFPWLILECVKAIKCPYDIDAFALHGIGGATGAALTGLFSQTKWNPTAPNGSFFGHRDQLGYQLACVVSIGAFSAIGTLAILVVLKYTIGIKMTKEEQEIGADDSYHGQSNFAHLARRIEMQELPCV
jgi:ammonium transporter, Amt family